MPELYPDAVEGPYTVPSGTDIADGPQAFRDFADSLGGLSDTLEVFELAGDHTVSAVEMGGLFTHSGSGMTLTIEEDAHPVGSVCAVSNLSDEADAVVTVETPNLTEAVGQYAIMSFTQVQQNVWIPNGGGAGGGAIAGTPGAPVILKQGGPVINFAPGAEGDAGPTQFYGAEIDPIGPTVDVEEVGDGTYNAVVSGATTPNTDYVVEIFGVNVKGRGESAFTNPFQLNYNNATGGDEVNEYDDYDQTGERWRVHVFLSTENFEVIEAPWKFRSVVNGAGGTGGTCGAPQHGDGGNGGYGEDLRIDLEKGTYLCKVGTSGDRQSRIGDVVTAEGGENRGCSGGYQNGKTQGPNSTIRNGSTQVQYGAGGRNGENVTPQPGPANTGKGGGGSNGAGAGGAKSGGSGIVIISYKIAPNTRAQIAAARSARAATAQAEQAGYERGLVDGIEAGAETVAAMGGE
jgi:hypothetical protein